MGMEKDESVHKDVFEALAELVMTMKEKQIELTARVAAHDAVIRALLQTTNDSQRPVLTASIRSEAEAILAVYDDSPYGQQFCAEIGKSVASLLARLK